MIEFKNVAKYYKTTTGVAEGIRNINLKFSLNEFVAITGESGSGKTTLLNVLSGFDSYEDGEILINGNETSHFTVKEWETFRSHNIGFVFQNYNIIESYSVYQNIIIALEAINYDKSKKKERALELIKEVGLETHVHHKTAKLSGGQKQRVVIARALAKDSPIILADEPTGNLDKASGEEIMKLLKKISKDKLVVLVTHNFKEAEPYVTRNVVLEDGNVKDDKVINEVSKTDKIELNEEIIKNKPINALKLAIKNIFATPKRTIFLLSLSLLTIIAFLFFYSNLILSVRVDLGGFENDNEVYILNRNGDNFSKEDYLEFKSKYQTRHLEVYPSIPFLMGSLPDDVYYDFEIMPAYNIDSSKIKDINDVIVTKNWVFDEYELGDIIKVKINDKTHSFKIVDKINDYKSALFVNEKFLFDFEAFKLNEEFFDNIEINELLVVGLDRSEINIFKNKVIDDYRVIDNYLMYEDLGRLGLSIASFFLWMVLIGILAVLFLVTYNILKNMMQSRNKDVAIYRSVGVTETEVGLMILFEQIIVAFSAFLITYIALQVLANFNTSIYKTVRFLTFRDYVLISAIFLIFSILQGLRFNKKIFNLTVIESLKEGN